MSVLVSTATSLRGSRARGLRLSATVAGVLLLGTVAAPARAQSAADAAEGGNEIIVTAQRRSESIEKVPISVAAFDQKALENINVGTTNSLQFGTPGITNTQTAGDGISAVFIRGVGTGYSGPGLEGSVAVYLDDVYLQTQTSSAQNIIDVSQVEVLKGPQGTLYGRNATGGAVVVTTNDPKLDLVEGYVKAGYGKLDWARGEAVLNVPLGQTLAVRAAGFFERRDGYVDNVVFPSEKASGTGAGKTWSGRVKALWEPSPDFQLIGTFGYDRRNGNGSMHRLAYFADGTPTDLGFYETSQSPAREGGGGDDSDALMVSLRASYTTGDWTFSNTFAYRRARSFGCTDNDGLPEELIYFCLVSQRSPNPGTADGKRDDTYTNEFRIVSDGSGPLNVTLGAFYEHNKARFAGRIGGAYIVDPVSGLPSTPTFDNRDKLDAYSVYGEVYYNLTDALKVTGGLRYTHEKKSHSVLLDADALSFVGNALPEYASDKTSFSNVSPRVVLAYDAGAWNFYASYSQGFKSGGFNSPDFAVTPPLRPEKIYAEEIGAKYRSDDGKFGLSAAAYHYDWKGVQVAFIVDGIGIMQQNAASAEIYGGELNFDFAPSPAWKLNAGMAYTHGRFTNFPDAAVYDIIGGGLTATAEDLSDTRLPHAPDFTANGSVTYNFPIGNWEGRATAAAYYTSKYDFTAGAGGELRANRQGEYAVVNLSGSFLSPQGNVELGWFVSNLFGVHRISLVSTGNLGVYMTPDEPTTFGGTVKYSF